MWNEAPIIAFGGCFYPLIFASGVNSDGALGFGTHVFLEYHLHQCVLILMVLCVYAVVCMNDDLYRSTSECLRLAVESNINEYMYSACELNSCI